jgi:hypothetical protein
MLLRKSTFISKGVVPLLVLCASASAAPSDRITSPVDIRQEGGDQHLFIKGRIW